MTALDFVVVGAQKAGTTQLGEHLRSLDGVWLPREEIPAFESPYFEAGAVDALRHRFEGSSTSCWRGIKRPNYLGLRSIPSRIASYFPAAHIVIMLRDPAQRAASAYLHYAEYGHVPVQDVSQGLGRLLDGETFGNARAAEILQWGQYRRLVTNYLEVFPESQVHAVSNQALRHDEARTVSDLATALGIPYRLRSAPSSELNPAAGNLAELRARRHMHALLTGLDPRTRQLLPRTRNPVRLGAARAMQRLAQGIRQISTSPTAATQVNAEIRLRLDEYYAEDVEFVTQQLGVSLS